MSKLHVFETTCDGRNYAVVWTDTMHGPQVTAILHHNTEVTAHITGTQRELMKDRLAEHIVKRALKL